MSEDQIKALQQALQQNNQILKSYSKIQTERSEQINELASALAKAQGKMKAPTKNKTVDFTYNGQRTYYKYADLADTLECVKEQLSVNGLSVVQTLTTNPQGSYGLNTMLLHSSGQFISSWHPLSDPLKQKPQAFGSSLTYARRYSFSAIVGIASDEDDDGQAAAQSQNNQQSASQNKGSKKQTNNQNKAQQNNSPKNQPQGDPNKLVTENQLKALYALSYKRGFKNDEVKDAIKGFYDKDSSKKLTNREFNHLYRMVQKYDRDQLGRKMVEWQAEKQMEAEEKAQKQKEKNEDTDVNAQKNPPSKE